jgi:hypothetical protein
MCSPAAPSTSTHTTLQPDRTHLDCVDCADHQQPINNCRACTSESDRTGKWLPMFVAKTPARDMSAIASTVDDTSIETSESEAIPFVPTGEVLRPCTDKTLREFPEPVSPELAQKFIAGLPSRFRDALKVDAKPTNPKDAIGSSKLPLNLVPDTLAVYAAASFAEGASKYGAMNWRVAGVRASIYRAALERHLKKWWNGEDCDPKTKVPHLASVIACAAILLDADVVGKLTDDRPPKADMGALIEGMERVVKHVYEMHAHLTPHHHTAADSA